MPIQCVIKLKILDNILRINCQTLYYYGSNDAVIEIEFKFKFV